MRRDGCTLNCEFISDAIYDGRLHAHPSTKDRFLVLKPGAYPALKPADASFVPVTHEGCTQSSVQETEAIAALVNDLMRHEVQRAGVLSAITPTDILVVAPYNMQVNLLRRRLPKGVQVGTVDKFQGKQAAVVIVSMAHREAKTRRAARSSCLIQTDSTWPSAERNALQSLCTAPSCLTALGRGSTTFSDWTSLRGLNRFSTAVRSRAAALEFVEYRTHARAK